ncbi:hypothetical protein [Methylomonas sp. MgM2]
MSSYNITKGDNWIRIKSGDDFFNSEYDRLFEISRNIESGKEIIKYVELNGDNKFVVVDCFEYDPTAYTEAMELSGYAWLVSDENEVGHRKYLDSFSARNPGCLAYNEIVINYQVVCNTK